MIGRLGTPARRDEPELMDAPGLPAGEVADAYRTLRRVNRQLGNLRTMRREWGRFLAEDRPAGPLTVLDVGAGSGDLADALAAELARRRQGGAALVLDRDRTALDLVPRSRLRPLRGDALRLPLADASVDLVTAVKFAHHFSGPRLVRLVSEMARVARRRVLVLDIRRHWLAYAGFVLWSRVFTRNRLVRYDGPLSVLRGFTPGELEALGRAVGGFSWSVRRYAGFQLVLAGSRRGSADGGTGDRRA